MLLCRALCAAKRVLLLDEPTTSLDEVAAQEMYDIINELNNKGLAVIMITHDIVHAVNKAKHILSFSEDDMFFGARQDYQKYIMGAI